jgi:hypothetical protein
MAVAVLAGIGELARERHQSRDIRRAQTAISKLYLTRHRITDPHSVICGIAHETSDQ